ITLEMSSVNAERISSSIKASDRSLISYVSETGRMGVEGKACRKRSRASKRTPTTVLNTDTSNFKAMVQHFTGAPISNPNTFASSKPGMGGYHNDFFPPNKFMAAENSIYAPAFNVAKSSSLAYDFPPQSDMTTSFMNFLNERTERQQNFVTDVNSSNTWDEMLRIEYPASTHIQ
ncbi:hypothetical protein KI387_024425, partial [Taxus chinensis]